MGKLKEAALESKRDTVKRQFEKIPKGWHALDGWAEKEGLPKSTALRYLKALVKDGKWQCKTLRVGIDKMNRLQKFTYYGPK